MENHVSWLVKDKRLCVFHGKKCKLQRLDFGQNEGGKDISINSHQF